MMNNMSLESTRTTLNSSDSDLIIVSRTELDSDTSATPTNSGHDVNCSELSSFVIEEKDCDEDSTLVFQELSGEDVLTCDSLDLMAHSQSAALDFSATQCMHVEDDDNLTSGEDNYNLYGSPTSTTSNCGSPGSALNVESPLQRIFCSEISLPASAPLHHSTPKANPLRRQKSRMREQEGRVMAQISLPEDEEELCVSAAGKLTKKCCKRSCSDTLNDGEIERARHRFMSKNTTEQNQFLIDSFQISNCSDNSQSSTGDPDGMIEGRRLCCTAFTGAIGVSKKRYKTLYEQFKKGVVKFERKPMQKYESTKVSEAKAWMTRYFNTIGDHMPHVQQTHLPHFLTKRDIYERMVLELIDEGISKNKVISQSYFYEIWESCFKHVVIPEVSIAIYD